MGSLPIHKAEPFRSRRYLDWVKTQPSVISGQPGDDPHHVIGHGRLGSVKHSDLWTFPLTRVEHDALHSKGAKAWEEEHGSQLLHALRTIERAVKLGILVVK